MCRRSRPPAPPLMPRVAAVPRGRSTRAGTSCGCRRGKTQELEIVEEGDTRIGDGDVAEPSADQEERDPGREGPRHQAGAHRRRERRGDDVAVDQPPIAIIATARTARRPAWSHGRAPVRGRRRRGAPRSPSRPPRPPPGSDDRRPVPGTAQSAPRTSRSSPLSRDPTSTRGRGPGPRPRGTRCRGGRNRRKCSLAPYLRVRTSAAPSRSRRAFRVRRKPPRHRSSPPDARGFGRPFPPGDRTA